MLSDCQSTKLSPVTLSIAKCQKGCESTEIFRCSARLIVERAHEQPSTSWSTLANSAPSRSPVIRTDYFSGATTLLIAEAKLEGCSPSSAFVDERLNLSDDSIGL
jgi:hypothetical protein